MLSELGPTVLALQDAYVASGFGERTYHGQTTLHPVGLLSVLALGILTLTLHRKHAWIPIVLLACFISTAQRIVVLTLDFNLLRVLVLVGWARVLMRGEHGQLRLLRVDRLVLAWALAGLLAFVALRGLSTLVSRAGLTYDIVGMYFLFRVWIRSWEDVDRLSRLILLVSFPSFILFFLEYSTGRNPFAFFGGANPFTTIRDGRLRCMGPFYHPILAGSFWAVLLPLAAVRFWRRGANRLVVGASVACILGIVFFSGSSTPVMVVAAGVFAAGMYLLRRHMRLIRWATVAGLVVLHIVMKAPVWHLISRVNVVGGSTGYHRYRLVDAFINRFSEWFLIGTPSTAHWGYYLFDVTNQYVLEGVRGGLLTLVLFLLYIGSSFGTVGQLWRTQRKRLYLERLAWALGVVLFAHCAMFIAVSISHSQQNLLTLFLVIACVASLAETHAASRRAPSPRRLAAVPAHRGRVAAQPARLAGGGAGLTSALGGRSAGPRASKG